MEIAANNEYLYQSSKLVGWEQNRRFYEGDHWMNSRGYMGQKPPLSSKKFYDTLLNIQEGFVSENVIKEVIDAHLDGFKNPDWQILKGEQKLPKETDDLLVKFWDGKKFSQLIKKAARKALTEEKVLIRMYVPSGYRETDTQGNEGLTEQANFQNALRYIHFEIVNREKGGVYLDTAKQMPYSIYNYRLKVGRRDVDFSEVSFVDEDNLTHLVTFKDIKGAYEPEDLLMAAQLTLKESLEGETVTAQVGRLYNKIYDDNEPLDLNGHLYLYELEREEFITEQIRSKQKVINLAWTMGGKNINVAGVRQRDYFNTKQPESIATGAAANFLYGVPIKDEAGKIIGVTTPNMSLIDPSDPEYFIKTRYAAYAAILGQCGQRHRLTANDGRIGEKSRKLMEREFNSTLNTTKFTLDPFGRWMLEITLYFAAAFSPFDATGYRADYQSVIKTDSIDAETRGLDQTDVSEGRMDLETYIVRNISDDAKSVMARLDTAKPPEGEGNA